MHYYKRRSKEYGYRSGYEFARFVALVSKLQRPKEDNTAKKNTTDPKDDPLVRYTRRLVCATWVIAFVGILAFGAAMLQWMALDHTDQAIREQARLMQGQLNEMQADQQPWVRPQITKVDPIVISGQKLSFGITLQFFNSGKSPAFNVDYWNDFIALDYPRLFIRHDGMCNAAEMASSQTDERLQKHFTIFPNEMGSRTFYFPIETSEVDKYNVRFGAPNDPNPIFLVAPVMIGCVAYRSHGSSKYHHTWFSYDFGKAAPDGTFMRITSGKKVIDAPDVRIQPSAVGRNDAD